MTVIGGGLAGITAALDCAQAGAEVTLLEVRRRLGGAAYSFTREGLEMDNGQHVFLRCCLAYRALLARLGSDHLIEVQPRLRIPVLKPGEPPFVLKRGKLPAPLQLAGALARYPHLSRLQRLGAVRAALALIRAGRSARGGKEIEQDAITLGAWLARHGQGEQALAALWDLIALPTLNVPAAEASLELGAFVFQRGCSRMRTRATSAFTVARSARSSPSPPRERCKRQASRCASAGVPRRCSAPAEALRFAAAVALQASPRTATARVPPVKVSAQMR